MRPKPIILMLAFMLVLTIFSSLALAIGVSPTQQEILFQPNLHQSLTLRIVNQPAKDMKAVIYARGELAEYITFTQTIVSLSESEQMKTVSYSIDLPSALAKPGLHEVELVVMEYPEDFGEEENTNTVKVVGAVVSKLYVRVPYPAKYAEGELQIGSGNIGENIPFTISLFNFGTENINSIKAKIEVFGPTYERLGTIETETLSLEAGKSGKLTAAWKADVNQGVYHAKAIVTYDSQQFMLEKNFDIGNIHIDITGIDVKNFRLGGVAKLDILLQSEWNSEIRDVYGNVTIKDDSTTYTTFKTASIDIPAMQTSEIISYWDTTGIAPGRYTADIRLSYAGKTTEKSYDLNVGLDSIKTIGSPTGELIGGSKKESSLSPSTTLILILIIVLVVANIFWVTYFNKRLKKK